MTATSPFDGWRGSSGSSSFSVQSESRCLVRCWRASSELACAPWNGTSPGCESRAYRSSRCLVLTEAAGCLETCAGSGAADLRGDRGHDRQPRSARPDIDAQLGLRHAGPGASDRTAGPIRSSGISRSGPLAAPPSEASTTPRSRRMDLMRHHHSDSNRSRNAGLGTNAGPRHHAVTHTPRDGPAHEGGPSSGSRPAPCAAA